MAEKVAGTGGNRYVPFEERTGNTSIVYFTRDLSAEGIAKVYERVNGNIKGKVAIKCHTGEKNGPNIIPSSWVRAFMEKELPDATIVETNTFYVGDRYTTELHRETLKVNGWDDFTTVDIMDEDGTVELPIEGGKWNTYMTMGKNIVNYDSLFVLTHFKGHTMGGFGGSNKNIGIGCADGRIGKGQIHRHDGKPHENNDADWSAINEEFMERMTESSKATVDHFGKNITFVNVMRNMSVSCDCEGCAAMPVVTPNIGIVASTDICAIDSASIDLVYALEEKDHADLVERIQSRHGHRQLSYMQELGMGNTKYILIDIDNNDCLLTVKEAVKDVKPFKQVKI